MLNPQKAFLQVIIGLFKITTSGLGFGNYFYISQYKKKKGGGKKNAFI